MKRVAVNRSRSVVPAFPAPLTLVVVITSLLCAGVLRPAFATPERVVGHAAQADLSTLARSLPRHGTLRVEGVPFEGVSTALELERFEVFAPDAQVVIARRAGDVVVSPPDNGYFRGGVEGDVGTVAVLMAHADGGIRGLIMKNGVPWVIGEESDPNGARGLSTRQVDMASDFPGQVFRCGTEGMMSSPVSADDVLGDAAARAGAPAATATVNYTARVAVDTDYEFFQLFGDETAATDYIGDLFAYASTIYEGEINTSLLVSYIKLWATSADPWTQTSCGGMLDEFGTYWTQNNGGISRTIAHMLSGKAAGCGMAYVGGLCDTTYGYGVSSGLDGSFNAGNPGIVWDILVVSHEIGHNFNSPHTHCYNGIGGIADPVDQCYGSQSGCYAGPPSLPCSLGPGHRCGTIMSYCHLLGGGYSNTTLTFGLGFPYGVSPGRVPTRMHDYVVARAASYSSCLQLATPPVTETPTPSLAQTPTSPKTRTPTPTASTTQTPTSNITVTISSTPTVTATPTTPQRRSAHRPMRVTTTPTIPQRRPPHRWIRVTAPQQDDGQRPRS